MVGANQDPAICCKTLDYATYRSIQPHVDFGNELAELGGSLRIMSRVSGIHVRPVIVLCPIKYREHNHHEVPISAVEKKRQRLLAHIDRPSEFLGTCVSIRYAVGLDDVIGYCLQQFRLEGWRISEFRFETRREHAGDHRTVNLLRRISSRHVQHYRPS